ncbi:hypothetical protein K470DRAFT_136031 [Piedraia hortae CBS 480.64]|uniref:Uncharacterized protein n=1 Tax=Piedraia hortae CBS 480.64 TaxID=1314780 RepID=A0A6A7BTM3_9PEZI|nr:hypothetical protein K470DRAFT_136031 [Piedraia hortae CBS 480.64]
MMLRHASSDDEATNLDILRTYQGYWQVKHIQINNKREYGRFAKTQHDQSSCVSMWMLSIQRLSYTPSVECLQATPSTLSRSVLVALGTQTFRHFTVQKCCTFRTLEIEPMGTVVNRSLEANTGNPKVPCCSSNVVVQNSSRRAT